GNRGREPDSVNAENEIEPLSQIGMLPQIGNDVLKFAPKKRFETPDFVTPVLPNTVLTTGFAPSAQARDILIHLLDESQPMGKRSQASIRRSMDLLRGCGTLCDQSGIDFVILGSLQMERRVGSHLRRLEYDHYKTILPKMTNHLLLVPAARLDADPIDTMLT